MVVMWMKIFDNGTTPHIVHRKLSFIFRENQEYFARIG